MAVRSDAVAPVSWKSGSRLELARDGRPQADRDSLHRDLARLLRRRRDPRAAHARAAGDAERDVPDEELVQRGVHHPRHDDDLPRRRPDPRRVRQLPDPADDRRARHGVPAPERALVLAVPVRRDPPVPEPLLVRRLREGRLVVVSAAVGDCSTARATARTTGSSACTSSRCVAARRDQLHRHDREHARARDDVDAPAAVRVVDVRLRRSCSSSRCRRSARG